MWIKAGLTFAAALAGGWCGRKSRIPAGTMVGAIIGTAIWNIVTEAAYIPGGTKPILQIAGGILLGHTINRSSIALMRKTGKAVFILLAGLLLLNVTLAAMIHLVFSLDFVTALFATAPGGVSDMALIAEDFNADTGVVSIMQLFRMFGIYLIYPPVLKKLAKDSPKAAGTDGKAADESSSTRIYTENEKRVNIMLTIFAGILGGLLLKQTGIPAGALVGSVAACSVLNIFTGRAAIPDMVRFPIQAGVGALIGAQMTLESVISLKELAGPIVIMIAGFMIYTFLCAIWMHRGSGLDFTTCLLALTPGGIQETSLLAQELGGNMAVVIVMHTVRLVAVICGFPILLTVLGI